MHRTSTETRSASSSTASVAKRLSAYTAAATGAVLASSSSDAAVIITTITTVNASTNFTIDLDISGAGFNFDYTFSNIAPGNPTFAYGRAKATNQADSNQFIASAGLVGSGVFLGATAAWNSASQGFNFPTSGNTGYLGFRLTVGEGASIYGWIEYVNNGTSTTVSRWAYESQVGTGITTPGASAVPGGAGLAALAFGAAGVRGRRRHRG